MNAEQLYEHLENLLEQLDIAIAHENLSEAEPPASSGLCKVKGRRVFIMDRSRGLEERIRLLRKCLNQMDLDEIYVLPAVREFLRQG